ncbi:MAG: hypothetical protein ABIQ58_10510 [Candidatus Limnocylindrales bacterium]
MTTSAHDARDDTHGHAGAVANQTDDHGEDQGHDDRAHGGDAPLGPIDAYAWGAGALGVVLGLVVAVCFMLATGDVPG